MHAIDGCAGRANFHCSDSAEQTEPRRERAVPPPPPAVARGAAAVSRMRLALAGNAQHEAEDRVGALDLRAMGVEDVAVMATRATDTARQSIRAGRSAHPRAPALGRDASRGRRHWQVGQRMHRAGAPRHGVGTSRRHEQVEWIADRCAELRTASQRKERRAADDARDKD